MQTRLIWLFERSHRCVSRTIITLLALLCLTLHGTGVGIVVSTVTRLASEESSEESKSEAEDREASHKCSRLRLISAGNPLVYPASLTHVCASTRASRSPVVLLPTHLVGAGINIRC